MQSVQRHFAKYMRRSADEQHVSVLLKDFEEADRLLTKIIEASRAWRESWVSILTHQQRLCDEFGILYGPIIGAGDDYHGHVAVQTPDHIVRRTHRIATEYEDLKRDLTEDLAQVEESLIKPAADAQGSLQTMKKPIKKREDRKLDFERYQSRVDSSLKKTKRSERENAALIKAQAELSAATEAYAAADEHLRNHLPRLLTTVFSLLPHFLAAHVRIQNALLGHYYTMLHAYCTEEGFPSPSPPMDEVIRLWDDAFKPVQREAESMMLLANGKAVKSSFSQENGNQAVNGYRRPSAPSYSRTQSVSPARALPPSPAYDVKPKLSTSPSPTPFSLLSPTTPQEPVTSPSPSPSVYQTPMSYTPAGPNTDYFSRDRQPSAASIASASTVASIAQKKRPPPPPPPSRLPSHQMIFVTALYDFEGQSEGDLAFREGDRIRVLKKTESTDDWWQGELRGVKGPFPANYCQ